MSVMGASATSTERMQRWRDLTLDAQRGFLSSAEAWRNGALETIQ
jgi:hypothetical protein